MWQVHPGTVVGTQDNALVPTNAVKWREKKGQLEVMTGRTWPNPGASNNAKNMGDNVLQRFWQDCVADRVVCNEAILLRTIAQPKSMFSHTITVMDKVEGWEDERQVGS